MGTVLLGGCAQAPQPVPEPPLQYEDPAVPPPPVAYTDKIREVAVVETTGSRGGAALRAQEDLDVLANGHYEGVGRMRRSASQITRICYSPRSIDRVWDRYRNIPLNLAKLKRSP